MQAIVRKFSGQASSLALTLALGAAMAACAGEVTSEEELAELEGASEALVPSTAHWLRTCRPTPSGPACEATQCASGQYVACWGGSCSCTSGWSSDSDGSRACASDEHVECSDRGTGMGCYCARGLPPLLPQKPLPAYPLELAATQSDSVAATFARFDDGSVWGWGNGSLLDSPSVMLKPKHLSLGGKATKIVAGDASACALLQDGTARCWGTIAGVDYTSSEPVRKDSDSSVLTGLIGLTHGGDHVCGWRADGHVFCWGDGSYSRYGDPAAAPHDFAFEVSAVTDATQVVASWWNTCFLRKTGTVACVGLSHMGQLGTGEIEDPTTAPSPTCVKSLTPNDVGTAVATDIPGLKHVAYLSGGGVGSFCAETRGGTFCWGSNERGLLGLPTAPGVTNCFAASATPVKRAEGPYHVFGPSNTCVWSPRGRAQCWGSRASGLLLDSGTTAVSVPQALPFAQDMTSLTFGARHACYAGEGVIRCWGSADDGRLGNSSTVAATTAMVSVEDFSVDPGTVGGSVSSLVVPGTNTVGAGCGMFDTGIDLTSGQTFKVSATGTWSLGPGASYVCSANGTTAFGKWEGMDYGGLVGRIGSGPTFWLGGSSTKAAAFGGRLKLGMLDSDCANNSGALNVTVTR